MSLGYLQRQQKDDPPLEWKGWCSSSSCTAWPENIKAAQQQVLCDQLWKPLHEHKQISEIQTGNTPHFFTWVAWRQLHLLQSLLQESLREISPAEQKFCTVQHKITYFTLKKTQTKPNIKLPMKMRNKIPSTCLVSVSQLWWKGFLARAVSNRYKIFQIWTVLQLPICEVLRAALSSTSKFQPI